MDVASTDTPVTSATPTTSAAAVRAVRLGLRAAFSVAIVPVIPLMPGDGPSERLGHGAGDQRSEHEQADEQHQHPRAEGQRGAGEQADQDQGDARRP